MENLNKISNQNYLSKVDFIKVILLALAVSIFYLDINGVFINSTYSDVVNRFSDFRQHAYQYFIEGENTTNPIYREFLLSNPSLLPRSLAFLAKIFNNFNNTYLFYLISITVINIISFPFLIFSITKKQYLFLTFICLMPFFTIPSSMSYGYSIMPISGCIGMSLIMLLFGVIISKQKLNLVIFSGLLLFIVHPLLFSLYFPLILIFYFFINHSKIKTFFLKSQIFGLFVAFVGLIWPIFLSFLLGFYKKPDTDFSKIVEWISIHNYLSSNTEKFIVIFGFLSIIYSLKLTADYLYSNDFKSHALIVYYVGWFGIGLYIFNILFVETRILNISSVLMPLRHENIMVLILVSMLIFLLTNTKNIINNNLKFYLSLYLSFCFSFGSIIFSQRGILIYLSPIFLLLFLKNNQHISDYEVINKKIIIILSSFILFVILYPLFKFQDSNINFVTQLNSYLNGINFNKLILMYSVLAFNIIYGLLVNFGKIKNFIVNNFSNSLYKKIIVLSPIIFLSFPSHFRFLYKYFNQNIITRKSIVSDEEKVIKFISNNLRSSDSILQHPQLPIFRRRLPNYFSTDVDLVSLYPYLPNKIKPALCEYEKNYLLNTSSLIKKSKRFTEVIEQSFKSKSKWESIKKYHLLEQKIPYSKLSNFCKDEKLVYKGFNYILEPITEKVNPLQTTIYENEKYRLSKIGSNRANLNNN